MGITHKNSLVSVHVKGTKDLIYITRGREGDERLFIIIIIFFCGKICPWSWIGYLDRYVLKKTRVSLYSQESVSRVKKTFSDFSQIKKL